MSVIVVRTLFVMRHVGFAVIGLLAILLFVQNEPDGARHAAEGAEQATLEGFESDISSALSEASLNEISADSAPQQSVVNGWVARDLLEVLGRQNRELLSGVEVLSANQVAADGRAQDATELSSDGSRQIAVMVLLGVLALCWHGATAQLRWPQRAAEVQGSTSPVSGSVGGPPPFRPGAQPPPFRPG